MKRPSVDAVEPDAPDFKPVRVLELDAAALESIAPARAPSGATYERAWCLVRLHSQPLGMLDLELDDGGIDERSLTSAVRAELGAAIDAHLARDGLDSGTTPPRCVAERERFLADAPFMTVIVPTRERAERLRICLDSILASEYPRDRYTVLVVDNAPATDATRQLVESAYGDEPRVRYLREASPGSASARNAGLRVVDGELIAFTDDDVRVDRHWLTEIARGFAAEPDLACVSGLLLPTELDTPAQLWFEQYGGFSRGFERRLYDLDEHRPAGNPLYPYTAGVFGTGNNFAFRRSVLAAIGDFDPALGNGTPALGGVDSEALLRTIVTGHRILYEPAALVWHAHRPDYAGLQRQVYSYGVGLTAYLLKTMLAYPRLLPDFARRVPRGLRFALSPSSSKNENKRGDYPRELTRLELRGMLYGPLAYARSRRRFGPHRRPS